MFPRPRLELVVLLLREELDIDINKEYFWTDPKVVISAIQVKGSRSLSQTGFSSFVIFQMLHRGTMFQLHTVQQMTAGEVLMHQIIKSQRLFKGPSFLSQPEDQWPKQISADVSEGDPEVKTMLM